MKGIIGKKLGMTQIYNEAGALVPVTVVEAGPCTVLALRTKGDHGYSAIQLGYGTRKAKNVSKAARGHVAKAGLQDTPPAKIKEFRTKEDPELQVGDVVSVDTFSENDYIDVTATSKGRGFSGVVRRYRFKGGRASHGGGWTRRPGSIGMRTLPGKVYKGRKMPGQHGNDKCTVQNLKVVQVRAEENLLLIKGSIPGPAGGVVIIRGAAKK
jgi:large subunit ribosomal protein L3